MLVGSSFALIDRSISLGFFNTNFLICLTVIGINDTIKLKGNWLGWDWSSYSIVIPILIFLIMKSLPKVFKKLVNSRLIKFFGDLVYPLYLFHIPIGIGSMLILRNYVNSNEFIFFISLTLTLVFSFIISSIVEKPGISFGRKLVRIREKKPASS